MSMRDGDPDVDTPGYEWRDHQIAAPRLRTRKTPACGADLAFFGHALESRVVSRKNLGTKVVTTAPNRQGGSCPGSLLLEMGLIRAGGQGFSVRPASIHGRSRSRTCTPRGPKQR